MSFRRHRIHRYVHIILNIDDISKVRISENYLYNKLKDIGLKENIDINENRLYSWYINFDFILLKFMCHRGSFREDINEKCILCEYPENSIKHVLNKCKKLSRERRKLSEELNKIDNTNYKELLKLLIRTNKQRIKINIRLTRFKHLFSSTFI